MLQGLSRPLISHEINVVRRRDFDLPQLLHMHLKLFSPAHVYLQRQAAPRVGCLAMLGGLICVGEFDVPTRCTNELRDPGPAPTLVKEPPSLGPRHGEDVENLRHIEMESAVYECGFWHLTDCQKIKS